MKSSALEVRRAVLSKQLAAVAGDVEKWWQVLEQCRGCEPCVAMPGSARISLFAEMDAAADALRKDNPNLRDALADELQILFREIQQRRMPELATVEWIELFKTWGPRLRRAMQASARGGDPRGVIATSEEYARANVPADLFVCPCGEVLDDPCSPALMTVHQPHYFAAKEPSREGRAGEAHT